MRVLVTSWAWGSHYMPLVPTIWALRAAGHEVRVASQPRLAKVITDSGAVAVSVGADLDHEEVRSKAMGEMSLRSVPQVPVAGESMSDWSPQRRAKVTQVFRVFTAYSEAMLDDLFDYASWWRPDLVIFEPTTYAGALVAAALGIPAVRHTQGIDSIDRARAVATELVTPLAERLGLPAADITGAFTMDPCPPSLQFDTSLQRKFIRYIPYNGRAVLPHWVWEREDERPRVCLTWGTSTSRLAGQSSPLLPQLVEWLGELDCEVVACVDPQDAAALSSSGARVRIAESLPLHLVLPSCAAIVHQGGNGTLLTAGHHGVPQLVLPQLPDQTFHARQFADAGAGRMLLTDETNADSVRAEVDKLLSGKESAEAARTLRTEILAQPSPAERIADLEALAAG